MAPARPYDAIFEDWLTHALLPFGAYATLGAAAVVAHAHPHAVNYVVGGVTLVLLFAGIHNAWDAASYHVLSRREPPPDGRGRR